MTISKPLLVHLDTADRAALERVAQHIAHEQRLTQPNLSATIRRLIHDYDRTLTVLRSNEHERDS